jgi:Zn-dependent protease
VFGGMSHLEGEPHAWRAELWMAIVGPIVSLLIGGVCIALASFALAGEGAFAADPLEAIRGLGPGATLMLWLGPVNIVLALFNLVPAFPLDGVRVGEIMKAEFATVPADLPVQRSSMITS